MEDILVASPWETNPEKLRKFMETIKIAGGLGNEAIEIGLLHANNEANMETGINQIILIGDAPPNTPEEVRVKREKNFGEKYWSNSKFGSPTTATTEAAKLKDKKIPIHAFYVDNYAKKGFEELAKATDGKCEFLDIHSEKGSETLTDLVTVEILRDIGSRDGSSLKLIQDYNKKYNKSYN